MNTSISPHQRNTMIGGIALVLIGTFAFVAQFLPSYNIPFILLGGLAILFVVWGSMVRNGGLLIPAGILSGLAVGIWLTLTNALALPDEQRGAVMILSLAGGFVLVTILWFLVLREFRIWPLIVAAILALVGGAIWVGGTALTMLAVVGQLWPLIFVILGATILWRALRGKQAQ